jgi:hypothetical protein
VNKISIPKFYVRYSMFIIGLADTYLKDEISHKSVTPYMVKRFDRGKLL